MGEATKLNGFFKTSREYVTECISLRSSSFFVLILIIFFGKERMFLRFRSEELEVSTWVWADESCQSIVFTTCMWIRGKFRILSATLPNRILKEPRVSDNVLFFFP